MQKERKEKAREIFSSVGKEVIVDNEDLIDTVTAVSGSGPAYYFLLMEEMIKAGTELGLPEAVAKDLVLQTFDKIIKIVAHVFFLLSSR